MSRIDPVVFKGNISFEITDVQFYSDFLKFLYTAKCPFFEKNGSFFCEVVSNNVVNWNAVYEGLTSEFLRQVEEKFDHKIKQLPGMIEKKEKAEEVMRYIRLKKELSELEKKGISSEDFEFLQPYI